jgi:hypothetical protein
VLLLLVQVGMEMDLVELSKVGRASMLVACIGVALPFIGGALATFLLGEGAKTAVFVGAALTATSVGITARVFGDLRALATTEARIVIGAAVADDVLGLVILTVVVKIATGGSVGFGTVAGTLGLAIVFLVATGAVGLLVVPKLLDHVHRKASSGATVVVAALVLTFAFAELPISPSWPSSSEHSSPGCRSPGPSTTSGSVAISVRRQHLDPGLLRADRHQRRPRGDGQAERARAGGRADRRRCARQDRLGVGASGTRGQVADRSRNDPRGEVGLIFASIGLANGVLDKDLYGALLMVVLVTTIITLHS